MKIQSTIPFAVEDALLLRLIEPGEVVDVTVDQARHRLTQVGNWVPADDEAKAIHDEVLAALNPEPVEGVTVHSLETPTPARKSARKPKTEE
jgi:hypothetical protein